MIQATIVLTVKANFGNGSRVTNFAHEAERAVRKVIGNEYQSGLIDSASVAVRVETEEQV
jgi:hypothetical protein